MRWAMAFWLMMQLLLQGVAVQHCHALTACQESPNPNCQPHVHWGGMADAHHAHGPKHGPPSDDSPLPVDHEDDVVYVSSEWGHLPVSRVMVPERVVTGEISVLDDSISGTRGLMAAWNSEADDRQLCGGPRALRPQVLRV
ncbi:MAG: hypothetical protein DWH91_08860 [Planctomycetota bacterium]|nr:MAG: hypothetical protein DWH91_08860 [Planctomycetota bacterium]